MNRLLSLIIMFGYTVFASGFILLLYYWLVLHNTIKCPGCKYRARGHHQFCVNCGKKLYVVNDYAI